MTDLEYFEEFAKLYNHPSDDTKKSIEDMSKHLDVLLVNSMKLSTAAGPWDGEEFEQNLIDCKDLLDLYSSIRYIIQHIREETTKEKKLLYTYTELVNRYLRDDQTNGVKTEEIEEGD